MTQTYNRRTVLASLGAVGALAVGSNALRQRRHPYSYYTYAQSDTEGVRLSVAWYETYNGEFQEATNGSTETNATVVTDPTQAPVYIAEAPGPIVTLSNVLPGDSGTVSIGLLAEQVPPSLEAVDVWFKPTLTSNAENQVTEPEARDPGEDGTGTSGWDGELAEALEVQFFADDGFIGGCDGQFWLTDTPITPEGSLGSTVELIEDGVELTGDRCLAQGERRCFGFTWHLPASVGNLVQSDSVEFDLAFVAVECNSGNPFDTEENQ